MYVLLPLALFMMYYYPRRPPRFSPLCTGYHVRIKEILSETVHILAANGIMGRRAKNKQPAPQPLPEPGAGRKGMKEHAISKRNAPKAKQNPKAKGAKTPANVSRAMPAKAASLRQTPATKTASLSKPVKSKKQLIPEDEDEEDLDEYDSDDLEALDEDVDLDEDDEDEEEAEDDASEDGEDEDEEEGEGNEELSMEQILSSLGLPKNGKLTERQKKKALAEAERLELLLKSSGHSLEEDEDVAEDEEDSEEGEEDVEGEEDEDEEDVEDGDLEGDEFEGLEDMEDLDEEENLDGLEEDDEEDDEGDDEGDDEENAEAPGTGFLLPTVEEEEQEKQAPLDLQLVQMRIQEVVTILADLPRLGEPGRSRADYMDRLSKDVQTYYGYNEFLTNMFLELFSPDEAIAFFEANEVPRPVTIRTNTLRTRRRDLAQKLINRGASLEPVGPWSKVGLQVFESSVPIGATPEYLVGDYMLQAVSSFLPCVALAPQPNERVLDMASAPGGKVTYLSALMQNTGCIFANDSNKARIKSLTANIHRMGCRNVVVCNYDGRQFPKVIGGFDRVMLDSPCSGTGVVSKDPSVKTNKSKRDFILLSQLQKQLILCAIDSVNPRSETGGYVVYSTCSVTVEENEEVVEYALRKRPNVRIVPTGIDFGRDGFKSFRGKKFDDRMPLCRRIFPHVHNMDGFFVCKLKVEPINKGEKRRQEMEAAEIETAAEQTQPKRSSATTPSASVAADSLFDEAEDEAIMQRSRERMAKKRRM